MTLHFKLLNYLRIRNSSRYLKIRSVQITGFFFWFQVHYGRVPEYFLPNKGLLEITNKKKKSDQKVNYDLVVEFL